MNQQHLNGAEARVIFCTDTVIKTREPKGYRHPDLDRALRRSRTRREASLLRKAPVRVPTVLAVDEFSITMERIHGEPLRNRLVSEDDARRFGHVLGSILRALHDADIVHGDLTTSNVLVDATNALVLIDFGLAQSTARLEQKAVDLHVLRETLEGSHPLLAPTFWDSCTEGYGRAHPVIERLRAVEKRGRNKAKY
jgi:Kae1-associated kinase Bud32